MLKNISTYGIIAVPAFGSQMSIALTPRAPGTFNLWECWKATAVFQLNSSSPLQSTKEAKTLPYCYPQPIWSFHVLVAGGFFLWFLPVCNKGKSCFQSFSEFVHFESLKLGNLFTEFTWVCSIFNDMVYRSGLNMCVFISDQN